MDDGAATYFERAMALMGEPVPPARGGGVGVRRGGSLMLILALFGCFCVQSGTSSPVSAQQSSVPYVRASIYAGLTSSMRTTIDDIMDNCLSSQYVWGERTWQLSQSRLDPLMGVAAWSTFMAAIKLSAWVPGEPRRATPHSAIEAILDVTKLDDCFEVQFAFLFCSFSISPSLAPSARARRRTRAASATVRTSTSTFRTSTSPRPIRAGRWPRGVVCGASNKTQSGAA